MDRRNFLKALAVTGAVATIETSEAMTLFTQQTKKAGAGSKNPDLVAVMGGEPDAMYRKGIAELGGMKRFVKKGQKVCVKPNIGWDKRPELGANTNPLLVAAIVKDCFDAGASEVVVFDHTCDDWVKCYKNSGIQDAVEKQGGKMVPANQDSYYQEVKLPRGKNLKSTTIHNAIMDSDVWINVPVLKNHEGSQLTISMKNLMGIVWDRGYFHRHDLQQCIADVATLSKPAALNIVDAYRVMTKNGPRGRSEADVVTPKGLFISTDPVAVDMASAKFFNQFRDDITPEKAAHIARGEELKVGNTKLDNLNIKRIKM